MLCLFSYPTPVGWRNEKEGKHVGNLLKTKWMYTFMHVNDIDSLTSRQWGWGILQVDISPLAPGLPIALWSASKSESGAPPAAGTDRRSLEATPLRKTPCGKLQVNKDKSIIHIFQLAFKTHTHTSCYTFFLVKGASVPNTDCPFTW